MPRNRQRNVATLLGVMAVVSLGIWAFESRAVALWREQATFLTYVLQSYLATPVLHVIEFTVPTTAVEVIAALVGGGASVAGGWWVARARVQWLTEPAEQPP